MTEKRFEYVAFDGFTDNGKYITPHEVADLLNELVEENEQLKQFKQKVFDWIDEKIKENEFDLNNAVKAGMPTMELYGEIEMLETLKKELKE